MTDQSSFAPRSVLVVQAWGIGDVIMTTPVLRAIRERWPQAEITLAVSSRAAGMLLDGSPFVDRVVVVPRPRSAAFFRWLIGLRSDGIQLAIVATRHHAWWPTLLRIVAGIQTIAADYERVSSPLVSYRRRVPLRDTEHRIDSNLALFRLVGGNVPAIGPHIQLDAADLRSAKMTLTSLGLSPGQLMIGVHPGSEPSVPQKRYPTVQLARSITDILKHCASAHVLVFFGGEPTDERVHFAQLHERVHVVADLPLRTVAALESMCAVFVAGDTGLAHVAAALGVPVVVMAGPTQVRSTAPKGATVVATDEALACMPCFGTPLYGRCTHVSCMKSLSPIRVSNAVIEVLSARDTKTTPSANSAGMRASDYT